MRYIWRKDARLLTYDLTAAYWTLRLRWDASMLCGFCWQGRYLVWLALPFGISEACRIFQAVQDALWRGLRCGRNAVLPRHAPGDARGEQHDIGGHPP